MDTPTLTAKEAALLAAVKKGMDEPGSGWLHEINPFDSDHVAAGVLGSLIAKGIVRSDEDGGAFWVTLAPGVK